MCIFDISAKFKAWGNQLVQDNTFYSNSKHPGHSQPTASNNGST